MVLHLLYIRSLLSCRAYVTFTFRFNSYLLEVLPLSTFCTRGHAVVTAVIRCAVHWAVYDVVYYILCIICDVVIFALFSSSLPFRSSDPWLHSTPLPPGHNVRGYIAARGEHAFIAAARRAVFQRYMPSSTRVAARGAHEFIAVAKTAVFQRYIPSSTLVELCVH